MSLSRNLIAGITSSAWTALISLAVVPLYLKYLGIEGYGLVGFFATLQAVFSLLDLGLATTMNRETARFSVSGGLSNAANLLHTLAVVYWTIAAVIALVAFALAAAIAGHWLHANHLSHDTVKHAIMLMGLVLASRWPIGLYQGALVGAQKLTVSSGIAVLMTTIASLGAILVLAFVSPTIQAFFIWQAIAGLLYALAMRRAAWEIVGRPASLRFDMTQLKTVWRFSAGMSVISILGLLLNQLDKVILSRLITLSAFAHYMLASTLVSGLFVIVSPAFNTIYPRFTAMVAAGEIAKLTEMYRLGTRSLATLLFPIAMMLAVFSEELVMIWTRNHEVAMQVAPILSLLVIGTAIQGVMYFPYALQLAYGMTRLPLIICTVTVVAMVPSTIFLAWRFQAPGGAMAWLAVNVLYLLLGTWLTHRHLLKDIRSKWLMHDVGIPLVLTVISGLIAHFGIEEMSCSVYLKLFYGGCLVLIVCMLSLLSSPQLRLIAARLLLPGRAKISNIEEELYQRDL